MSELKEVYAYQSDEIESLVGSANGNSYYLKSEADEAIAELKREIKRLVKCCKEYDIRQRIDERIKINGTRQLRATKRALWLARANRALEKIAWFKLWNASISTMNPEDGARQEFDKWKKALGKCLKKAEEYK